ncbi:MAG: helix-turn-helix domain-containing protein [Proteobacteria bacterium]|nr:helix-turn-helix domain-containing protein [Pseudomonadota bacterium]
MKSAAKLFSVFETLCLDGETSITELSTRLKLGKSSVHRFLSVLRDLGYVERNGTNGRYFATLKIFEIGAMVRGRISLVQLARPHMEELGRRFHETINLALSEQGEVVYVDKVESAEALRMDLTIGRRVPAYCTALGKVFLANLTEEDLGEYLQNQEFRAYTQRTMTSAEEIKRHLDKVRRDGFAIDDRELDEGIRCIAAPIRNESDRVIAAISIAGPSMRMSMERLKSLQKPIMDVTKEISRKLGHSG